MNSPTLPLPTGARQRRKEARPQELIDAALAQFVEKGFTATRIEEVAQRAGVSKGTLYLYFPSKEDLFKAVVRANLSATILEGQRTAQEHTGSSGDLLAILLQTWWEKVGNAPAGGITKIIMSEVRNFPELANFYAHEVIMPANALVSSCVERGIQSGEFRPVPVMETVQALIAPVLFLTMHKHSLGACPCPVTGAELDPLQVINTHIDLVLRGLSAR